MGVFDTFYILFKSNAKEYTRDAKEADKAGKDLEENLKKQKKEAEELGKSFTKVVEGLTSAVTAYISFGAVKSGLINQAAFTTALERTKQATGQNIREIAIYGQALEQFGGTAEGFQQTLRSMTQLAAEQGRQLPPLAGFLQKLNREFQGLSLNETARRAGLLGITDPAMVQLLRQTTDEFDKQIGTITQLTAVTDSSGKKTLEFTQAWNQAKYALGQAFTSIDDDLAPALTGLAHGLTGIAKFMQGNTIFSVSFMGAVGAGITAMAGAVTRLLIPALLGLEVAASPVLGILGIIAGVLGLVAVGTGAYDYMTAGKKDKPVSRRGGGGGGGSAVDFWMSQGYTRAQAAAWAAQEQRESSGNPNARNAGHYGLYQWSEERRAKILAGLGIDVATASIDEQRRAAAWEAEQRGDAAKVKSTGSVIAASDYLTRNFERPASGAALEREAAIRSIMAGKIAIGSAEASPYAATGAGAGGGGNKTVSVSMGDVHVHSQATDAKGIAVDLNGQIQSVISNHDDGVAM